MLPSPEEVATDLRRLGLPCPDLPRLEPIPGDAGGRRYVRVRMGKDSLMLMLVPEKPDRERGAEEDGGELPYLNVQRYLKTLDLPVPEVHGWDPATRRLYQEDFGSHPLSATQDLDRALALYSVSVALLCRMQERTTEPDASCFAFRRRFDTGAVRSELAEFSEAGIPHTARRAPDPAEFGRLDAELDALAGDVAALPACFSHRDFHGDNLLVRPDGLLGMIDFQDAFLAPRLYDLASLLTDRGVPARWGLRFVDAQMDAFVSFGGMRKGDVEREFWLCVLQRQMKVAGRFVNLARRGKPSYLDHLPATWGVIGQALDRTGRRGLKELLASLGCPV